MTNIWRISRPSKWGQNGLTIQLVFLILVAEIGNSAGQSKHDPLSNPGADIDNEIWQQNQQYSQLHIDIEASPELKCHHIKELLSNYSQASSAFIECAVCNAKPVQFCGECVLEYQGAENAWEHIRADSDCKEDILVSDKLQIVSQTQTFLRKLWQDGLCENCYNEDSNFQPTNATIHFFHLYNETIICFEENGGSSNVPVPDDNATLCHNCSRYYHELNKFYASIGDDNLCMDLIDLMNRTRMQWKNSGCRVLHKDLLSVVALSVFVAVLPGFFYLTAKIHGTKKQEKLVDNIQTRERRAPSASSRLFAGTTASLR